MNQQAHGDGHTPLTKAEILEKFARLQEEIPGLPPHSPRLAVLLAEIHCKNEILKFLEFGVTDIWLPMDLGIFPDFLNAGPALRFRRRQKDFLSDRLIVTSEGPGHLEHFHLARHQLYRDQWWLPPKPLQKLRALGDGGFGFVEAVCHASNEKEIFALKRIERKRSVKEELEAMRYVKMELDALRKIRHQHFIRLICGYTDDKYVGFIMQPVADYNLGAFLDSFQTSNDSRSKRYDENLIASFFGCLATALHHLHFHCNFRHRDIKPANILVQGQNVLLTDFGIALDFDESGYTSTQQERMRSPVYSAPEISMDQPRNTKSDIWSLGCVFLEMAAVLNGEKRDFVETIIKEHGKYQSNRFYESPVGISEIIRKLRKKESKEGTVPLNWIEKMLQIQRDVRPNSNMLRHMILDSGRENSLTFWGICCKGICCKGKGPNVDGDDGYKNSSLTGDITVRTSEGTGLPSDEDVLAIHELLNAGFDKIGIDSTQRDRYGMHWAIEHKKPKVVDLLLKNNAAMPGKDQDDEWTVLHMAAKIGDAEILRLLIERKLDVNDKSRSGWTPLHSAVQNGRQDAVELLLKSGADPKARVGIGWTALHSAAERGFESIARLLLDHGAEASPKNHNGITPVYKAAWSGHGSVLRLLVGRGAKIDERASNVRSSLHAAASRGCVDVVKLLLELHADIDAKDKDGATPLHLAAFEGHTDSVRALLDKGAEIDKGDDWGITAVWRATQQRHQSVINLLVEKGANVNIGNKHGWTPLLMAADDGNLELVASLAETADLEQTSGDGRTALHMSVVNNHTDTARLLLKKGANIAAKDWHDWTPLHWAASRGHFDSVSVLLENGADKDAKDDTGKTALQRADGRGHTKVANLLKVGGSGGDRMTPFCI